jgi:hypothetical protein
MAHWSTAQERELAEQEPSETAPAPLAPVERVAELFEALATKAPELVAELIGALAGCEASDVVAIFGGPRAPAAPAEGRGELRHINAGAAADQDDTLAGPAAAPGRWSAPDRDRADAE